MQSLEKNYVIRIKIPIDNKEILEDVVQGTVEVNKSEIDDYVLVRRDGTPTYMLSVVVDDHDLGVNFIIRGDDHLNNYFRQKFIYEFMNWEIPTYAHIPLIHGPDGKKMSKRHGATGVDEYQTLGYSAAGMRNYLARLGWSHGDSEFFSDEDAKKWFDLEHIGRSPSRFDFKKLANISGQHIAHTPDEELLWELESYLKASGKPTLSKSQRTAFLAGVYCVKSHAKTMEELFQKSSFMLNVRPILMDDKAQQNLNSNSSNLLKDLTRQLQDVNWDRLSLEEVVIILFG